MPLRFGNSFVIKSKRYRHYLVKSCHGTDENSRKAQSDKSGNIVVWLRILVIHHVDSGLCILFLKCIASMKSPLTRQRTNRVRSQIAHAGSGWITCENLFQNLRTTEKEGKALPQNWIIEKSRNGRVARVSYLTTETFPAVVIKSTFPLLPLNRYLLPVISINRNLTKCSSGNFFDPNIDLIMEFFSTTVSSVPIAWPGIFWVPLSKLDFFKNQWI